MAEYEEEFEVDAEGHTGVPSPTTAERVPEGDEEYGEEGFDERGQSPNPGHREESLKAHYARLLAGIESSTGVQTTGHTSVGVQSQGLPCSDRGVQYPEDYTAQGSVGVSEEQAVLRRLDTRVGQQRFTQFLRAATDAVECALEGGRVEGALHPAALAARRQGAQGLGGAVPSVATLCPPPPPQTLAAGVAATFPHLPESTWALLTSCRTPTALAQSPTRPGDFCCAFGPPPLPVREAWAKGVHVGERVLMEAPQGALSSPSSLVGVWTGPKVVPWRGVGGGTTNTAASEEGKALASLAPPPTFVLMARGVTVTCLAFSPAGDVVIGGTQEGLVCVWALGEPNWMHPTLVSTLEGGGGGSTTKGAPSQGIHYPTGVRLPSVILTAPSNGSGGGGGGGGGGGAVVVQVCALVRDTKASLTTAAVEEARMSGSGRRGVDPTTTFAGAGATAASASPSLPLRRTQQHLKTGAGLCTLLPEYAATAAAAASAEGDENRGGGQVSEQPEKQQQQQQQRRQQSPLATLQYTSLPSFKTAASGAAWTPSSPPGTPHPPHTFQFLVACQDGSLTSYVALPMDLPKNDVAESMRHLSMQHQQQQQQPGFMPAATATATATATSVAVSGVGGVSLGVLANTSGDTGRAPTGCIRVVQGDTTRVSQSGTSNSSRHSSSTDAQQQTRHLSTAATVTTTTSMSPSRSDTRLTLVGHPGGKVSHVHRHATGDLFVQPSPTTFLPRHANGHTFLAQGGGGDAAVITHNPLLTTLFAVGYSHGGGIAVFSTHHSLPIMACTDPWASGSTTSAGGGGGRGSSILCISWVRERPHTLVAVSREGGVALWDLRVVCAPPACAPSGGEVPPHCVFVPPTPTPTLVEKGGVVSAVCSGGSGLHPYTLSPVSIILAHASGQISALALHPAWYLPEGEPEGEVGRRLAGVQRALEG